MYRRLDPLGPVLSWRRLGDFLLGLLFVVVSVAVIGAPFLLVLLSPFLIGR